MTYSENELMRRLHPLFGEDLDERTRRDVIAIIENYIAEVRNMGAIPTPNFHVEFTAPVGYIGTDARNSQNVIKADDEWIPCDGREVGVIEYPELFNVIGYAYGYGPVGTFRVPNMISDVMDDNE